MSTKLLSFLCSMNMLSLRHVDVVIPGVLCCILIRNCMQTCTCAYCHALHCACTSFVTRPLEGVGWGQDYACTDMLAIL